jgi:hypothetical protein
MRSCLRLSIAVLLLLCIPVTGCSRLYVNQVAKHPSGKELTVAHAPRDGWYDVRYTKKGSDDLKLVKGTEQWVPKGTPIGFASESKRETKALVGEEELPLPAVKKQVKYRWYSAEVRQTQFGREMQKVGEGTLKVMGVAAVGALYVGMAVLDAQSDEDCHHAGRHCCD